MKNLFSNIKGDAFGGITAGIVALPLALAFGVSSGLGPSAGLYGAIFISFFAALFGGTNTQISGPTAPMTAVSMVVIASIIAVNDGNVEKALPAILMVFFLAGLIQIGLGVLGLGKYIRYIPYPVVSGFMTAIGVIILLTQILPAIGYYPNEDEAFVKTFEAQAKTNVLSNVLKENVGDKTLVLDALNKTINDAESITQTDIINEAKNIAKSKAKKPQSVITLLPRALSNINWLEFALALGTIVIIYGFKRITKAVPSTLVALVVMTGIAIGFKLNYRPIEAIPSGFPVPNLEVFTNFKIGSIMPYFFTALTLALLGAIDSLLTSVVADNMTKTKHKPNRELVGQGIGNTIASVFGGIPGAGATIRTVVNIQSGGKTKLSGMIAGVLLLIILLGFSGIASKIPTAVLAGILLTVGIGVMDYKGLKAIPSMPKDIKIGPIRLSSEVLIMFIVLLLSTFWDLIFAVGIGLVISSLMFMKKIGHVTAQMSDVKPLKEEAWDDEIGFPENLKEEVFIKHIKGPLFFGSTNDFQQLAAQIPTTARTVILRFGRMQYMDQSGLYVLEDILLDLRKNGVQFLIVDLLPQPRYLMERIDIIPDLVPNEYFFKTFDDCLQWIKQNVKNKY